IETDSFNANAISLADYHLADYAAEINRAAARLARSTADAWSREHDGAVRYVAGSVGPTNRSLSMSPSVDDPAARAVTWKQLTDAYFTQITALIEGGVDCLLIETVFDTLNAKAALWAADEAMRTLGTRVPVMLSVTLTESGRTLSGQTIEAMLASVAHAPLMSVGLNCGFGAEGMLQWIEQLAATTTLPLSVYPNAGLPNEMGCYDETPATMVQHVRPMLEKRLVNIVGGCCGTTPEHIAALAKLAQGYKPREIAQEASESAFGAASEASEGTKVASGCSEGVMRLSGYELRVVTPDANFLNIGERCNVAGSRKFLRLINDKNYAEAVEIARRQVLDGAQVVDVNMDDAMLDAPHEMSHFLRLLAGEPDVARVPVMIDSSNWDVICAGLECLQGKGIVNSISLKDGEATFCRKAEYVRRMGAAVVVMAFDEEGQADTFVRKTEVCRRAYDILVNKVKFNPQDIIFDPNVLTIATGIAEHGNYAADFIRAVEWIKKNLPGAKVSGGVSNLSFAFRGNNFVREAMHSAFLYHAIAAGLDMAIVNAGALMPYEDIPTELRNAIEDVIFNRDEEATDRLVALANSLKESGATVASHSAADDLAALPAPEQLTAMIVRGITEGIEPVLEQCYRIEGSAVAVIDGPLMAGMDHVGKLFGEGKLFLPQVVKGARTMKQAVAWLNPLIEADRQRQGEAKKAGRIVIATVKGDVHDIGKNIVSVIMRCNGFEVIDLGVMVPPETIIERAVAEKVDMVVVSGLITPSLEEMRRLAAMMQERGLSIPLFVGGATTSELHTAVKIAPEYAAPVVYTRDAATLPVVAQQLLSDREAFVAQWTLRQQQVREAHTAKKPLLSLEEARRRAPKLEYSPNVPAMPGKHVVTVGVADLSEYINWIPFYAVWKVRRDSDEAAKLRAEAEAILAAMAAEGCSAQCLVGLWKAHSQGDSIVIVDEVIPTPRQRVESADGVQLALSDFVAPDDDFVGTFAATVDDRIRAMIEAARTDDYRLIMLQSISDRIVEAAAEWLHEQVRKKYW
ncbi:MAG: methionine synthase, partial [Muribaculaceae bacterium]